MIAHLFKKIGCADFFVSDTQKRLRLLFKECSLLLFCARDRSRTDTDVTPLVPETSASAISPPGQHCHLLWSLVQWFGKFQVQSYEKFRYKQHPVPINFKIPSKKPSLCSFHGYAVLFCGIEKSIFALPSLSQHKCHFLKGETRRSAVGQREL